VVDLSTLVASPHPLDSKGLPNMRDVVDPYLRRPGVPRFSLPASTNTTVSDRGRQARPAFILYDVEIRWRSSFGVLPLP
jgi:hypothetical protein